MKHKPLVRLMLAMACLSSGWLRAQNPTYVTIDIPNAEQTSPYGINNDGAITGYYLDQAGTVHGFLYEQGQLQNIDSPACPYGTEPINLNSSATIVGQCVVDADGDIRGFMYQDGQFSQVGPAACIEAAGAGINDKGQVTGWCTDSADVVHGFLLDNGEYTFIDYPGANEFTLAWGINNAGLVTLQWIDSNDNYEAAVYNSQTHEFSAPITVPGAAQTYVHSINNHNDIVFSWYDASGDAFGAALASGQFYTIIDPNGPDYTKSDGINDRLQVVGRFEATGAQFEQGFGASYSQAPVLRRTRNSGKIAPPPTGMSRAAY